MRLCAPVSTSRPKSWVVASAPALRRSSSSSALRAEDVVAHRDERHVGVARASPGGSSGFSTKSTTQPRLVDLHAAEGARLAARDAAASRRSGPRRVARWRVEHQRDVHLVDVIGAEDHARPSGAARAAGPGSARSRRRCRGTRTGRCSRPAGTGSIDASSTPPPATRRATRCRISEVARYCVSTLMCAKPLFTRFESTKSISR